ncbi:MAG: Xaa-Pro dipeptidase [Deltaproteobacteria bacterium]|nr:Xaa-Pro dipeptidase [Deltaproteobacteria bacterium]
MTAHQLYAEHVSTLEDRILPKLEALGFDSLALLAGAPKAKSAHDDQDFAFVPTPAFAHFAPAPIPGAAIVLARGKRKLFIPKEDSFWEKREPPDHELLSRGFEIIDAHSPDAFAAELSPHTAVVSHDEVSTPIRESSRNPTGVRAALDDIRVHKTPYELACLRAASAVAARGHQRVREAFLRGEASELALHLEYLSATLQDDGETPYKNIVAVDEHAAVLHHVSYSRERKADARSLLLDAGATSNGYASDITRTWAKSSGPFAELVRRIARLQDAVIGRIEVGKPYESLHDYAHELLGSVLVEAGIHLGSAESAVETGITRAFLPHGLGHSLGIQVHDVGCRKTPPRPDNRYLRNTSTIEAHQVFTIEPGIYFIDSLLSPLRTEPRGRDVNWTLVDELARAGGIRVEDNIHVVEHGVENLTRPFLDNGAAP